MVANGALEKMSLGRVLVSVSTPHRSQGLAQLRKEDGVWFLPAMRV